MQHHRFTNHHDDGRDPDGYTMRGPSWQRPLRWLTIDLVLHGLLPARSSGSRPRAEKVELAVQWLLVGASDDRSDRDRVRASSCSSWLYILPAALAVLWLAFAFDYLPHHGLHHRPSEDKLKTTRNRVGCERLLSPCCSTRTTTWSTTCTRSSPSIAT